MKLISFVCLDDDDDDVIQLPSFPQQGGNSEEAKGQQQRQQQRLQYSFPAVKAARPVRHPHCATCAGATSCCCCCCCSGGFEFELVGILQRATHSLAPLALPSGATALHFTVFSYAVCCLYPSSPLAAPLLLLLLCLVSLLFFSPHSSWRLFICPQLYPWHASRTVQGSKAASRRGCYISRPQPSVRLFSFQVHTHIERVFFRTLSFSFFQIAVYANEASSLAAAAFNGRTGRVSGLGRLLRVS